MRMMRFFSVALGLASMLGTACQLSTYEEIHVGLADGSIVEKDVCEPSILGEVCDQQDNDCDGLTDDDDPDIWQAVSGDPQNCGSCFHVCDLDHVAMHGCLEGVCTVVTCDPGYSNLDASDENGCESNCVPTSNFDYCDGVDNNCDGLTDEDFDLQNDVHNCGACGHSCVVEYADPSVASFNCVDGQCVVAVCQPGHHDIDGDVSNGCEYACVEDLPYEACDGRDNDCNGLVDDNPQGAPQCNQDGVCAGTQAQCTADGYWECDYDANATSNGLVYESPETSDSGCDGQDNDCDGLTDEAFNVGQVCSAGYGQCRQEGHYRCTTDQSGTECDATPNTAAQSPEVCDGVDNDCDGEVDELVPHSTDIANMGSFVYVSSDNFTIFAYEASRPSATASSEGIGDNGKPCSVPGRMPWSNVTAIDEDSSGDAEAREVCQRLGPGWDLCTVDQWYLACAGSSSQDFPYGDSYQSLTCNGYDYGDSINSIGPVATGSLTNCARHFTGTHGGNVFDMSGNLKEWVRTSSGSFELRGGAYNNVSFPENPHTTTRRAPGLQCDGTAPAPDDTEVHLPSVGFRCCYSGNLF